MDATRIMCFLYDLLRSFVANLVLLQVACAETIATGLKKFEYLGLHSHPNVCSVGLRWRSGACSLT